MNAVSTVGIDLAKNVFSVHAVDSQGTVVARRTLSAAYTRTRVLSTHQRPIRVTQSVLHRSRKLLEESEIQKMLTKR